MLLRYIVFCLGCGMLQTAASRTPHNANPNEVPILFCEYQMYIVVQSVGLCSVVAAVVLGYKFYGWWGLITWLVFIPITNYMFAGRNPGPVFFVGLLTIAAGVILFFV
jgi:hypothetical protein